MTKKIRRKKEDTLQVLFFTVTKSGICVRNMDESGPHHYSNGSIRRNRKPKKYLPDKICLETVEEIGASVKL